MAITDNNVKWKVKKVAGGGSTSVMQGATATKDGKEGLVPAPAAGDQDKVLKGDGSWGEVSLASMGVTASAAELNHVDGVTGNIQEQLNGKLSTNGKAASATTADSAGNVTGTVAVANGGTGATTAAAACTNLGIFNSAGHLVLPNGSELWVE